VLQPDKTYHLSEIIYTFQKMGFSVIPPVIKGIDDYRSAEIDHAVVIITNSTLQSFSVYFNMPDYSSLPGLFHRKVTGIMNFLLENQSAARG